MPHVNQILNYTYLHHDYRFKGFGNAGGNTTQRIEKVVGYAHEETFARPAFLPVVGTYSMLIKNAE